MAHRERTRQADRVEREQREDPRRSPREATTSRRLPLNDYWIDGEGINREVLQIEICKYLGAEATSRPGDYNGRRGYRIKALRPFTPEMLDDLKIASQAYISENRTARARGYQETPYAHSDTRRRADDHGFAATSEDRFQPPSSIYPDNGLYQGGPGYPQGSIYSSEPGYVAGSGYITSGPGQPSNFPAMADPRGFPNPNYGAYAQPNAGNYPEQSYPYSTGPVYGEPAQLRSNGIPAEYLYSTTASNVAGRPAPVDERYGREYYESQGPMQPPIGGRGAGGYGVPQRGQPVPYEPATTYDRPDPSRDQYSSRRRQ